MVRFQRGRNSFGETVRVVNSVQTGGVTVTNIATSIVTINLGTVFPNDVLIINGFLIGTKGGTAGDVDLSIVQAGGTTTFSNLGGTFAGTDRLNAVPAAAAIQMNIAGFWQIASGGTLTVGLSATSAGSNLTVAANQGGLGVMVLSGS